jgi:hypothetical protein
MLIQAPQQRNLVFFRLTCKPYIIGVEELRLASYLLDT